MNSYRALEIYLNGQRLCIAGVKEDESLSAIVSRLKDEAFLYVGGSTGPQGDHSKWINFKALSVGDEITIKLVDTDSVDDPAVITKAEQRDT